MKKLATNKAIILDRDGVINKDTGYTWKLEDLELIENAAEAIKIFNDNNYYVFVVSNQSVIGRGICTKDDVDKFNNQLNKLINDTSGGYINKFFYCPHKPEDNCRCRKPKNYYYRKIINRFGITECYVVGDKESDLIPAEELELTNFLVLTGESKRNDQYTNCKDLLAVIDMIKSLRGGKL